MAKSATKQLSVRMTRQLKEDFVAFCNSIGQTTNGTIMLLIKAAIEQKRIPFAIEAGDIESVAVNGDGSAGRPLQDTAITVWIPAAYGDAFVKVCKDIHIAQGRIIKMFMLNCIRNGRLPLWMEPESNKSSE